MRLILRPAAETDIATAYAWYEEQLPGLGGQFLAALDLGLASVSEMPLAYPEAHRNIRRHLLRRFPYALFYPATGESVTILAGLHVRQAPRSWRSRA